MQYGTLVLELRVFCTELYKSS